jgi:hypothetical protein
MVVLATKMADAAPVVFCETEGSLFVFQKLVSAAERIESTFEEILSVPPSMLSVAEMRLGVTDKEL